MAGGSVGTQPRQPEARPWQQFEARTIFLRVAPEDWILVKQGRKTEFRAAGRDATRLGRVKEPTPVVGYTEHRIRGFESVMLLLEKSWTEPVSAISEESLAREGFPDMAHFRRYWMQRTQRRFRPLQRVHVYQVRPLHPDEYATAGLQLFRKLYGEHCVGH